MDHTAVGLCRTQGQVSLSPLLRQADSGIKLMIPSRGINTRDARVQPTGKLLWRYDSLPPSLPPSPPRRHAPRIVNVLVCQWRSFTVLIEGPYSAQRRIFQQSALRPEWLPQQPRHLFATGQLRGERQRPSRQLLPLQPWRRRPTATTPPSANEHRTERIFAARIPKVIRQCDCCVWFGLGQQRRDLGQFDGPKFGQQLERSVSPPAATTATTTTVSAAAAAADGRELRVSRVRRGSQIRKWSARRRRWTHQLWQQ